jgi:transcriptional regulator with XRE-family HTH domain
LKQIRLSLGLTQEKFAERAGLDYRYYQHIEAGRRQNLTMDILIKLAVSCGLELSELLNFETPLGVLAEDPPNPEKRGSGPKRRKKKSGS